MKQTCMASGGMTASWEQDASPSGGMMSRHKNRKGDFVTYDEAMSRNGSRYASGYNDIYNGTAADPYVSGFAASDTAYAGRPPQKASRDAQSRRKGHHSVRIIVILLLAMLGVLCGVAYAWYGNINSRFNNSEVISSGLKSELKQSDLTTEPFYMLLLGTDGRPGETSYRSDTIMLARIDPVSKKVTLVSIPRDTMVTINGKRQKINAAHSIGGAEGVTKAVSTLCGVDISHYAEVSFDGMQQLVDAVGGVDIDVEDDIYDPEHFGDMRLSKGQQHLDGNYAMFYARSRHFVDGDYARTRHQRNLVKALATQILNNTDAATIVPLVNSIADMVTTDMSTADIVTLANVMRGMDTSDDIYTCTIPSVTEEVDGTSYVVADLPGLKSLMDKVDSGEDPDGPNTMSEGLSTSIQAVQNSSTSIGSSNTTSSTGTTGNTKSTKKTSNTSKSSK